LGGGWRVSAAVVSGQFKFKAALKETAIALTVDAVLCDKDACLLHTASDWHWQDNPSRRGPVEARWFGRTV
jgi:hypothetical protein